MRRAPLIRRDLDAGVHSQQAQHADGLAVTATCHPSAPLFVWYRDGVLTLKCSRCHDTVGQIAVASVLLSSEAVH
jgi:hypothetical protein